MTNVIWLEEALDDLNRINTFLAEKNLEAASRALNAIISATRNLQNYPEIGKPYEEDIHYRELHVPFGVRGYVIHYRLVDDTAVIIRVWHAREERL